MDKPVKTKEQLHQEDLERIAKYRPLDDDFMRELFRDNIPLTEMVLRIITGKKDFILCFNKNQYFSMGLSSGKYGGRKIRLTSYFLHIL